jgi:hypothetical protein
LVVLPTAITSCRSHFTRRHQLTAFFVEGGGQLDFLLLAVEPAHAPQLELEVVPFGLGNIVEFVFRGVQRAGGHFVQQGFQMWVRLASTSVILACRVCPESYPGG